MTALPQSLDADQVVELLNLAPHPEGGWYRETFRDAATDTEGRARSTAILFLLRRGEVSAWHRIDAAEVWHFHAGAPLDLAISADGRTTHRHRLGPDLTAGERPQIVVPPDAWQSARSRGAWTLVGCTVAPGFTFDRFALAPAGWRPSDGGGADPG